MKLVKVLKIEDDVPEKDRKDFDCVRVTIDFGDGTPIVAYQNRISHRVFLLEQELLTKGTDVKLLESYHDAVREEADYDSIEED